MSFYNTKKNIGIDNDLKDIGMELYGKVRLERQEENQKKEGNISIWRLSGGEEK